MSAAWYNLALTHAWLGNGPAALNALEKYVALETDEERAGQAWTLAEIIRLSQGMEDVADHVQYSVIVQLQNPQAFVEILGKLDQEGILIGVQVNQEEGILTGVLLEKPGPALTAELEAKQAPTLGAYMTLMGNIVRLWHNLKEPLDRTVRLLKERAGSAMSEGYEARGPAKFFDIFSECLIFPRLTSEAEVEPRMREHLTNFFEGTWIHRPLKSLDGVPPIDAAGSPLLRKKLRGVVQFLQECADLTKFYYDFDRLRRKLNLLEGGIEAPQDAKSTRDISALGTPELAGLAVDSLTDVELDQAFVAAIKLDARELAGKFAQTLTARPPRADKPDRYPFFNHLINPAQAQGRFNARAGIIWAMGKSTIVNIMTANAAMIMNSAVVISRQISRPKTSRRSLRSFDRPRPGRIESARQRRRSDAGRQAIRQSQRIRRSRPGRSPQAKPPRFGRIFHGTGRRGEETGRLTLSSTSQDELNSFANLARNGWRR